MPDQYIGEKKVLTITDNGLKTPGGFAIMEVEYADNTKESFSSLMLDKILSNESCDATALREKRIPPVVGEMLKVLCDWGIRLSELGYMSILLNQSIEFNQKEALVKMWSNWGPKLLAPDDVDMITIDNVLRAKTINDTINPENK